jgi:hypothetical protein
LRGCSDRNLFRYLRPLHLHFLAGYVPSPCVTTPTINLSPLHLPSLITLLHFQSRFIPFFDFNGPKRRPEPTPTNLMEIDVEFGRSDSIRIPQKASDSRLVERESGKEGRSYGISRSPWGWTKADRGKSENISISCWSGTIIVRRITRRRWTGWMRG